MEYIVVGDAVCQHFLYGVRDSSVDDVGYHLSGSS